MRVGCGMGCLFVIVGCSSSSPSSHNAPENGGGTSSVTIANGIAGNSNASMPHQGGSSPIGGSSSRASLPAAAGNGSAEPYAPSFSRGMCHPNGPTLDQVVGARLVKQASGIDDLDAIALQGDSLYYKFTREGIKRLRPPTATTAESVTSSTNGVTWAMAATDAYVYSIDTNSRELWRASLTTLPAVPELVCSDVSESGLTADGTNLFFCSSRSTGTFVLPFANAVPGAQPTQLVATASRRQMGLWDGKLYYIENQSVNRVALTGGSPENVYTIGSPMAVTIADGVMYLVVDDTLVKRPLADIGTSNPHVTLVQGSPQFEGSSNNNPLGNLRVEGDRIYYREENGNLGWVKTDGSDCRIVVKLDEDQFNNHTWVMSSTHYYIIVDDTKLYEIPR